MGATSSVARKGVTVLFLALATVLAITNFYLIRQNRQLRAHACWCATTSPASSAAWTSHCN